MNSFSDCLDRLKYTLRVSKDQEVAEALGLSKAAFSERKKRGAFPEKNVRVLAQQRPDLEIDVEYVLTGGALSSHQSAMQERARQFTQTLGYDPNDPDSKQRLLALLDKAVVERAAANASRAATYEQIIEVLRSCSDKTVELTLLLVLKFFHADLTEKRTSKDS